LLNAGTALVAGGFDGVAAEASAELYDPTTDTWSATGSMTAFRGAHTATLLPTGTVLVAGGLGQASAELYDPSVNGWSRTGGMSASGDFAQTNTCGASLAPGDTCTINVTFAPTAIGARTGALTLADDAADSPQQVTLSGSGIASGLQYYALPRPIRLLDTRPD